MSNIVIGKYTLESLTSGMYSDPFVIYREYIQNAVDAIDDARNVGILSAGDETVFINLFPKEGKIEIIDNGTGIASSFAEAFLTGIGNSQKDHTQARGFRGIGRLAALSYCKKLIFQTSAMNESVYSKLVIDAQKMSELMVESEMTGVSAEHVMDVVCDFSTNKEISSKHYFITCLEGINLSSPLLDLNEVIAYLQQVAPVPFNKEQFTWHKEVSDRIKQMGYIIPEYSLFLKCQGEIIPINKGYADIFLVDRKKDVFDSINDIEVTAIKNDANEIAAIIWIAHSNYIGTIAEQSIKGLRMRKGNILIGDGQTLNTVFKDVRFNGWSIGEAYILDNKLLPNARRDNFEKNAAYFSFAEKMPAVSANITKKIRNASLKRNHEFQKTIQNSEDLIGETRSLLDKTVINCEKISTARRKIQQAKSEISKFESSDAVTENMQATVFDELDMLIGKVQGATSYKSINLLDSLSKTEKKILEKVFFVLEASLSNEQMKALSNEILAAFSS